MKKKFYNYLILIITILVVVFSTTKLNNVFGSNTDWINQHTIIPDYFRQLFYKTGKLIPSFALNYGGGQNIFNFSYYGFLSPIILPSYLLPFIDMATYMSITNIILLIASAILFYNFIDKHFKNNFLSLTSSMIFILATPLIFHMHRHIMFVNYMPFLVMSLIGVDKYVQEKKSSYLVISIFLMIMTSYYYSVCGIIVVGIYYLYQYLKIENNKTIKEFIKDLLLFISTVLISVIMSSALLLPTLYTLLSGRGESSQTYTILSLLTPYLKVYKIFSGTYAIGLPVIGFISIIYLLYSKKKENIFIAILTLIVLFIPIFRYILNGGLYLREKCFIPFIPLICYFIAIFLKDLFENKINLKKFIIIISIIFVLLMYFNKNFPHNLIFFLFIIVLLLFNKFRYPLIISSFLIICLFTYDLYESKLEDNVSIEEYNTYFSQDQEDTIKNILNQDTSFYRTNNLMYPTITMNKVYDSNYYTTNMYSSTYNKEYLNFIRNVFKNSRLEYNYFLVPSSNNILFNSFMGVKYLYSDYDPGLGFQKIDQNLYLNQIAYPIIYATNHLLNIEYFNSFDYPYQTELLLKNAIINDQSSNEIKSTTIEQISLDYQITNNQGVEIIKDGEKNILKVSDEKGLLTIKLNQDLTNKILFIDLYGLKENSCNIDNISIKINNVKNILTCRTWIYPNKNNVFRFVISDYNLNQLTIEFSKGTFNIDDFKTYVLDFENISTVKEELTPLNITKLNDNTIEGNINVNEDSYLITSIPYDNGFTVKVDGQKVNYEKVNTAFLGTKLTKGYHTISITYKAPLSKIGNYLSICGIIIFIIIFIFEERRKKIK